MDLTGETPIPEGNVVEFLMERMLTYGEHTALVNGVTGETYTYKDVVAKTRCLAAGLQKVGVKQNDVVAILTPNNLEYCVIFYGVALIGATLQTVNPLSTKDDIVRVLNDCNTKFIFTTPELLPKVKEALLECRDIKIILIGESEGHDTYEALIQTDHEPEVPTFDPKKTPLAILSSSGTTGFPKPVLQSHYNFAASIYMFGTSDINTSEETVICFLPMFHIYGLLVLLTAVHAVGSKVIVMPKFNPEGYLQLIQEHKATVLHVVPPIMVMLAKHPNVKNYDLTSVKKVVCGAAPLSPDIEAKVKELLNLDMIIQGYGMTEAGITHANRPGHYKHGSCGQVLHKITCVKVVDLDTGKELGPNEDGEILLTGPQKSLGYLNRPEEMAAMFRDGWVSTGDIGHQDEEGYLFIVDRLKELIKYKGFQVAPAQLETILLRHEAVGDVGVVGVADEEAGELPRAFVKLKPGKEVTEADLIKFVADQVSPHMKLRGGVEFIDEIPKSASGKILRRILRTKVVTAN